MAIRYGRGDVKQTTTGFRGPLMVQSLTSAKSKFLSLKLSIMNYDDFRRSPLPRLMERVKIRLHQRRIDFFDYGYDFEPPFLYFKSRYPIKDCPTADRQKIFESELENLGIISQETAQPLPSEFRNILSGIGMKLQDSTLVPDVDSPTFNLDKNCGKYMTYRQLIECGETQSQTGITNLPKQQESYLALYQLCRNVLDPIIDYFGMIKLTYGFCSHELSKQIKTRVDIKRDQHCAHELNSKDESICKRGGAAVDFVVEYEDMHEVAVWITENIQFSRMYFYGRKQSLHISFAEENINLIVIMKKNRRGHLTPKTVTKEAFIREPNN